MKRNFVFFLLLLSASLYAQNRKLIDSLRQQLVRAAPSEKFKLLSDIGFEYRYSYPDSTVVYCEEAYQLGQSIRVKKGLSRPLSFIGLALGNKGDFKKALDYHSKAIIVAQQQGDSLQWGFAYNNLGRLHFDQGEMIAAYDNFIRSKSIFEALDESSGLAYVYRSLANLYSSHKDYQRALENSLKAYQLRKELGDRRTLSSALMELGGVYMNLNRMDEALRCFRQADSLISKIDNPVTVAEVRLGIGEVLFETGKHNEAYEAAHETLRLVTDRTNLQLYLRATLLKARYFIQNSDDNTAVKLLEEVVNKAEDVLSIQKEAALLLAELYGRKSNNLLARQYRLRYEQLEKTLTDIDLNRQVERLQFELEIEKKERENDILKAKNIEDEALIAQQRAEKIVLFVVVIAVAGIATMAWMVSRNRRLLNQKLALQNAYITNQQEEIRQQNESLAQSNRILTDLNQEKDTLMGIVAHDLKSPLHRIFGLTRLLALEGPLNERQEEYVRIIESTTRSGLDLITDLLDVSELEGMKDAPKKQKVNIEALLQEKVQSFKKAALDKNIQLHLHHSSESQVLTDPDYVSRIVDNLLSNAIKFSESGSNVLVSEIIERGNLILRVKDSGPGFSDQDKRHLFQKFKKLSARPTGGESSNGLGLAIVKTLVDRLEGNINLVSQPGSGSEFIITIPVQ